MKTRRSQWIRTTAPQASEQTLRSPAPSRGEIKDLAKVTNQGHGDPRALYKLNPAVNSFGQSRPFVDPNEVQLQVYLSIRTKADKLMGVFIYINSFYRNVNSYI